MMSEIIFIVVAGEPVAKARARARIVTPRNGKQFVSFYTPKETEIYEESIKWIAKAAMKGNPPLDCPCEAVVRAYISIPASWSAKKTYSALQGHLRPISKPDSDNYLKSAIDGLNGIVFTDDARVWKMSCEKIYSDNPRLEIEIRKTIDLI